MTDNFEELAEMTSKAIPKDPNKCNNQILKRIEKLALAKEHQEKVSASIATATDGIEELLDKLRFECKNKQYECETLENKVRDIEHKQQKLVTESSKQDVQLKKKLSKLKAQLEMYESVLEVGIEDLDNGRLRDRGDKSSGDNKENNTVESRQRYAEVSAFYN
ncbi:unnamed protein product [Rodentolepis nana]|uniref:Myosin-6-like n=1 Tax=Rodentolepis nana TaxID=102285 RepID=A0A0R3TKW9_RODNA|nr:unnamed protein product [Rodentolepis nana]